MGYAWCGPVIGGMTLVLLCDWWDELGAAL
jgi:hypothetical protein